MLLEHQGYEVLTAADATSAFDMARSQKPNLIVLDIMMPSGTEGFHFVWKLRREEDAACREVPIIVVSAVHETFPLRLYPDQSDGVYGPYEYLPVQAFLDKPVEPARLTAEVERLLARSRGAARR